MKIVSWNVRGVESQRKRGIITEYLNKINPDIVVLQETKKESLDERWVRSLWKARFRNLVALPSMGRAGGIIVMWDRRRTEVIDSLVGEFTVSIQIKDDKGEWWFSGVYGPNFSYKRSEFWDELGGLSEYCGSRWCVGGDFNVVRFSYEKFPQQRAKKGMRNFDAFIHETGLRDINLANGKYTWSNFRENATKCKLDRFLFSEGWEEFFPQVRQERGDRVCLDHYPIILDTSPVIWGPTPFRFENMWLGHPKFKQDCKTWWDSMNISGWEGYRVMEKLKRMKGAIKTWNREVFGDTREIKKEIIERIKWLDKKEEETIIERRDTGKETIEKQVRRDYFQGSSCVETENEDSVDQGMRQQFKTFPHFA